MEIGTNKSLFTLIAVVIFGDIFKFKLLVISRMN